jgi:hypothetical protein
MIKIIIKVNIIKVKNMDLENWYQGILSIEVSSIVDRCTAISMYLISVREIRYSKVDQFIKMVN